ncbi:MAG: GMC family oxidoreductase [Myxococcota bacterium]
MSVLRAKVCVVGSGAGGALVACRLAQAGHDVVVLEAGEHVPAERMTQREGEMMRRLYWEAGLRASEDLAIGLLHGKAVGGSTVVNYLDCFRTPDRLLDQWADRHGLEELRPEKMRPRFERIEEVLHVRKLPVEGLNPNNRKLMIGADKLGWYGDTFHRNAYNCMGSGFCDLGCSYNAKQSAALTWLPLAEKAGARIYPECPVSKVVVEGDRAVAVEGTSRGEPFRVEAEVIVVSCGSIETPHLLLRSGVADPSGQLGRNLYLHPGTPVVGHFKGERVANYEGVKQGYFIGEFSWPLREHPIDALIEGIGAPPGIASTLFWGHGDERKAVFRDLDEFAVAGVLLRDGVPGRVTAGDGRPQVHWRLDRGDARRLKEAMAKTAEALFAAGATTVLTAHAPAVILRGPGDLARLDAAPFGPNRIGVFSFHQMGTCRMGSSRQRDVIDPTGRMWAYRNLYVADASVFPGPSGVNPQITVYGLCDVIADGIRV